MELDFFKIAHQFVQKKNETYIEVYPEFMVRPSNNLMTRGGKFYAVLNKETGYWETDEFKVQQYVDEELTRYTMTNKDVLRWKQDDPKHCHVRVMEMANSRSHSWINYKVYVNNLPDRFHQLDDKLCFDEDKVDPKDYISKRLPYKLQAGSYDSWNKIVGTLYAPEERQKIEWAIGSIISGASKEIQKFIVLYGDPGSGKGTILNIIQKMFPGYYEVFDAKSLSSNSNNFAFEQFRSNPLIALQMDGDLSRIEDNTKLNSLISHETILMNEKRKQSYNFKPRCFLFMASNRPVQMSEIRSGLKRRLIDVSPTGVTIPKKEYDQLMGKIDFELSGIAWHCLDVFNRLGKNYYNSYIPYEMFEKTSPVYNFVLDRFDELNLDEGIFVGEAFNLWKSYCEEIGMTNYMKRPAFAEEMKGYFESFSEYKKANDGKTYRGWFTKIDVSKLKDGYKGEKVIKHNDPTFGLVLDQKKSLLDDMLKDCQAQYGVEKPTGGSKPATAWDYCKTSLKDIDTRKLHFVRPPLNHIVIDFDLKNEKGEKDALLNLEAADKWPKTYAEYSQGGKGIHLHYIYDGDPTELESVYAKDIEIKVFSGKLPLRRRLSLCNDIPVATISCGLPKKEKKDLIDFESAKDERHIRNIIAKCLKKDIAQPYTAPAMSLIKKTLDDAYEAGIKYDVRDMRPAICAFAAKSHNQKSECMKMADGLHYFSKHYDDDHKWDGSAAAVTELEKLNRSKMMPIVETVETKPLQNEEPIVFFDIEVFPNLLLVNWKEAGEGKGVVRMINPSAEEIRLLFKKKLVGFNCRRYDNHILYARSQTYPIDAIYRLSQRIISGSSNAMFGPAYDISYTDVYDFAAKKQSLKKWEIELGIHHQELGLPWDQPVPEERWAEVAAYCDNDVIATEAVFNHLSGDFRARQILADIAGMKVNDTTNMLTTRIIFGDDPRPQAQFNYPDLTKKFPGYRFENGKSYYRHTVQYKDKNSITLAKVAQAEGDKSIVAIDSQKMTVTFDEEIGEGGRVYANPGIHHHVTTFDVASMHPSSIIAENGFGKYTDGFKQLLDIRIAIKHKDFEKAKQMLNGRLAKYLDDPGQAKALSQALKIAINSVYGLTAAGFDNKFRDPRNKDNWVAKRGALFIETLRLKVMEMGGKVVHIKTDSIKVEEPTKEISDFIMEYGKQWGYTFEIEDIYEKMCLVNDAVYIALRDRKDPSWIDECEKAKKKANETGKPYVEPTRWSATGAQFQHPYVFKTVFSHEPIEFDDLCETKTVTSALYLDMNENLTDVSAEERDLEKLKTRVKKLLKEVGYTGKGYSEWLDEEEDGKPHVYVHGPSIGSLEIEQIENELLDLNKDANVLSEIIFKGHNYIFVGKAGRFSPVKNGCGGGILVREKDGKFYSATGAKGYRWRESETLQDSDRMGMIDMGYFDNLAKTAEEAIREFGDFEEFASEQALPFHKVVKSEANDIRPITEEDIDKFTEQAAKKTGEPDTPPWRPPCGDPHYEFCSECPLFDLEKIPPECKRGYDLTQYFVVNPDELKVHRF